VPFVGTYDLVSNLPLVVEGYELEAHQRPVSSGFVRHTTVVRLAGGGQEGLGEDVTYDAGDQERLRRAGPVHDLAGQWTLASFSELLGEVDLFTSAAPTHEAYRDYRRWAFESAALDLALRQADTSLAGALGRTVRPVRFVVSRRLPDPPTVAPLRAILRVHPGTRFKLDPTSDWDENLVAELRSLDAVDVVDLKSAYRGTTVDQPPDPRLYRLVAEGFPHTVIEDPDLETPSTAEVLAPHLDRVSWDAPIHSVSDIEALPFPPKTLNVKPSRFGSVQRLLDAYDHCAARGVALYGGGQFELSVGRGHIQYLASLFHADSPNDVAPLGYDGDSPEPGTLPSPLPPAPAPVGFAWQ
jgi:hypothetical protein